MGIEYIEYRTGLFGLNSGSTIRQGRGRGGGGGVDRNKTVVYQKSKGHGLFIFHYGM